MNKWAAIIIIGVLVVAGIIYGIYESTDYDFEDAEKSYRIVNKWELPFELEEISGIHWIGDNQIACIQDEDGIIFIFDLKTSKIVDQFEFGESGDYEALTFLNGEYWVIESNGKLINVKDWNNDSGDTELIQLEFEYRNNIEGLAASPEGNLWLAVKDRNLDNRGDFKGIYAFEPETRDLEREPVLKIQYDDPAFDVLRINNPRKLIRPSGLTFHPVTNEIYVLDAEFQKFIVTDRSGKIKRLHLLDPEEFSQPEGICFSPSGRMFISNEGLGGKPNIIEVEELE
ncbi:hypothetical protein ML462_07725 [Gramella lutea]|uniref:Uncharacterized protein n=1 Tax=Christiangramia lutea TaxID=1607951 RepID=A0A9X2AB36_9FLAO|nr:SdiA-regulated domain-containing protein [Christiangramia lutea]MCH4823062.1 hypothetical protein [Christiangramia lutea]